MNTLPITPCYKGLFSPQCKEFICGGNVYTEDVGGSSPSLPTTNPIENLTFSGLYTNFPVGSMNLTEAFSWPI